MKKSLGRGIVISSLIGVLIAGLSFINNVLFIRYFGVNTVSDKYLFLMSLTISINYFFSTFFNANVIPESLRIQKNNNSNYYLFINNVFKWVVSILLTIYFILFIFYWINLSLNLNLGLFSNIDIVFVLFAAALPISIANCLIFEILNSKHKFKAAYIINLVYPIFIFIGYLSISKITVLDLTIILLLNNILVFIINYINLQKIEWSFNFQGNNFTDEFKKNLFVSQSNNLLSLLNGNMPNLVLLYLGTGSLTIVNTARSLVLFIDSALINNIGNVMGVSFSNIYGDEGLSKYFKSRIETMVNFMLIFIIPVVIFFLFYSKYFILIIYKSLPSSQASLVVFYVKFFSISLILLSLNNVLTRIHRSLNKLYIFSTVNVINNLIYVVVLFISVYFFKEIGIPLTLFLSTFISIFIVNKTVFNKYFHKLPFNIFVYRFFINNIKSISLYIIILILVNIYLNELFSFFSFCIITTIFFYKKFIDTYKKL